MKIKLDFITNSSSSAFLVAFPDKVTEREYVKQYISPEWKADIVFEDTKHQSKPTLISVNSENALNEVIEALKEGYLDEYPAENDWYSQRKAFLIREGITEEDMRSNHTWYQLFEREIDVTRSKIALERAKKFIEDNEGSYLYQFEYGDEDGSKMGEMEHGDTFRKLPHIGISHH